jgi:phage gp46-like protein
MARDIKLFQDEDNNWDIDFENGDFALTDSLDTALYLSVFAEKRASETQVTVPLLRRGHFTNEFSLVEDYQIGSLFWLYSYQAKNTDSNLSLIEGTVNEGISWMIEDNIISDVEVTGAKKGSGINLEINLTNKSQSDSNYYNLFINTFS